MGQLRAQASDPSRMIETVLKEGYEVYLRSKYPNYDSRTEDLMQLSQFAGQYSSSEDFLSEMALLTSIESDAASMARGEDGMLTLSSVHQAKGLEWSVVFVVWLAEGRFPSMRSLTDSGGEGEEEERRLFYVAVTRAKDQLFLSYPRFAADRGGRDMIQRPSRFLSELSGQEYERLDVEDVRDYSQW